ncbi:MAG TPA: hypothetical protein VHE33_09950, partial [Acidobacteriaceae bacterium]|nr:hypothetical protein [Acidobacteriaceae bacterium]
ETPPMKKGSSTDPFPIVYPGHPAMQAVSPAFVTLVPGFSTIFLRQTADRGNLPDHNLCLNFHGLFCFLLLGSLFSAFSTFTIGFRLRRLGLP